MHAYHPCLLDCFTRKQAHFPMLWRGHRKCFSSASAFGVAFWGCWRATFSPALQFVTLMHLHRRGCLGLSDALLCCLCLFTVRAPLLKQQVLFP